VLARVGLQEVFPLIVSAENITRCKPYPEGYLKALTFLNQSHPELNANASDCLAIEDSVGGIKSAITAGMKCVAVTNTYPREALGEATMIVSSLSELTDSRLAELFS
ncbi:MAG: haloacid dehalogenase superfamily protein, partial [bacterium]